MSVDKFALVTGASQGIGAEIARSLAKRGYHLLLVARSGEKLKTMERRLSTEFPVAIYYVSADLSTPQGVRDVIEWMVRMAYPISVLINNAGYGLWGRFDRLDINDQLNLIDLNVKALTELTYHFLPTLLKHKKSYILNVGSLAAYQAVPTLAVYAASKAYVLQFSRALRHEFGKDGLTVSTLNPGPVGTGFVDRAGMHALQHLMERYNMDASVVAERAVRGLFSGKAEVVPGFSSKVAAWGGRFLPKAWVERIAANLYKI